MCVLVYFVYMMVWMYMRMYVCIPVYVCMYVYMYVCMYCIRTHIIHTHTYKYKHTFYTELRRIGGRSQRRECAFASMCAYPG